ncbi:HlyD family secretion protein [Robiginitomaculum antarcticum]|uniref:HlyD family secretion protein n=1 Tax=Robiginitomaculum antarcticum TaxID=437507 RepID=UPI00039F52EA|nr:HlyD family efflux transporter periplasmic adaptor subunit [Robiginitomaculum antarcticum]
MTLFRQESLDYKRRKLHGEVILVQPVSFYIMTAVLLVLALIMVGFLSSAEYKRKETVAGYIAPEGGIVSIRAPQGGRIEAVYVAAGERVIAGQTLFLSQTDLEGAGGMVTQRRLDSADRRISDLQAQKMSVNRRYDDERFRLRSQIQTARQELLDFEDRKTLQNDALDQAEAEVEKLRPAAEKGVISSIQFERTKRAATDQKIQVKTIEQQINLRAGAKRDLENAVQGLDERQNQERSQIDLQIAQTEEGRTALEASQSYVVSSPINGTISSVQGTAGQNLNPSIPVMVIIPDDTLLVATLLAPSRAAGFLEPGQNVNLLIDAFPYQKFGVQRGYVIAISASPFRPGELDAPIAFEQAVYRVTVGLDKDTVTAYGEEIALKTGMTLQGDLIIDERSLLEWMLDPLFALRRS